MVAGSSGSAFIHGSKNFRAVVLREMGASRAGRVGRGWVVIPPTLWCTLPNLRH
jgi:hypothetical protein